VTRFGIALPTGGPGGPPFVAQSLADAARNIEAAGFESAWAFDAIGRGFLHPDPLTALAIAATVTRTIEVGTGVLQVPLRNPVELAQRALTTHVVSGGRFRFGVGAGSTAADFAALGRDFTARFRTLDESLTLMRRLWNGERVGEASLAPVWPAALGGPPILIGSWAGSRWIPRAAKEFDGWIASAAKTSYATLAEGLRRYRQAGGTRAVVTNIPVDLAAPTTPVGDSEPFHLRCAPDAAAERLQRLAALGFDEAVLMRPAQTERDLAAMRALLV
jgi:alkanesulfonate monooxygenase SsuD/methylene tetrahydromethanopterin reductase-like flavin-dependent oxidoreductase (luciferase family)